MTSRVICNSNRPASRHSAPRTPRAKVSHPACPDCCTPVKTEKRTFEDNGGLSYLVSCSNCFQFRQAVLRITRDLNPELSHACHTEPRTDGYLGCPYCSGALKTYSGRRASEYSTERYLRCSTEGCMHTFKAVYEFVSVIRPDPYSRHPSIAPLKTEYRSYAPYQQLELRLNA